MTTGGLAEQIEAVRQLIEGSLKQASSEATTAMTSSSKPFTKADLYAKLGTVLSFYWV